MPRKRKDYKPLFVYLMKRLEKYNTIRALPEKATAWLDENLEKGSPDYLENRIKLIHYVLADIKSKKVRQVVVKCIKKLTKQDLRELCLRDKKRKRRISKNKEGSSGDFSPAGAVLFQLLEIKARTIAIQVEIQKDLLNNQALSSAETTGESDTDNEMEIKDVPDEVAESSSDDEEPNVKEFKEGPEKVSEISSEDEKANVKQLKEVPDKVAKISSEDEKPNVKQLKDVPDKVAETSSQGEKPNAEKLKEMPDKAAAISIKDEKPNVKQLKEVPDKVAEISSQDEKPNIKQLKEVPENKVAEISSEDVKPNFRQLKAEALGGSDIEMQIKEEPEEMFQISSEDEEPNVYQLKAQLVGKSRGPIKLHGYPKPISKHINDLVITIPQTKQTRKIKRMAYKKLEAADISPKNIEEINKFIHSKKHKPKKAKSKKKIKEEGDEVKEVAKVFYSL